MAKTNPVKTTAKTDTGRTKDAGKKQSDKPVISTDVVHSKKLPSAFDVQEQPDPGTAITPQEMQFVRRVTELLPILSQEQVEALRDRIDSGYYANPEVTRLIADRLASIFGTD